jgi:hypothetical protein
MASIVTLLEEEKLLYIIRCDGCSLGYCDAESGLPGKKPVGSINSMMYAHSVFAGRRCPGSAQHQRLEGSNSRGRKTAKAAEWSHDLDRLVADAIAQQVLIDE